MDITKIPEPFRSRLEENGRDSGTYSTEITDTVYFAVDEEPSWEEARDRIFNGLEALISEARKAQNFFCKE